jgi:hypothetical protein
VNHPDLPRIRALLTKYVLREGERRPTRDTITAKDILTYARWHWSSYLPLMEGRYEALNVTRPAVARMLRLLDRIECGMVRKEGGEWVETTEATRIPDQIHTIRFLDSGRPLLKLGRPVQVQAQTLRNPFKKGLA